MHAQPRDARELEAASLALSGSLGDRFRIASKALVDLLNDPEDTTNVFVLGMVINAPAFPLLLSRIVTDPDGGRLLRERPSITSEFVDYDALRALPHDTLGGAYVRFLDDNGLDPDFFQPPQGLPEIVGYIGQRFRQTHDIWHVLTGYDTSVTGEAILQAFTFGQTGMPSAGLIAAAGSLRFTRPGNRLPQRCVEGFLRGRRAAFLPVVFFEEMWERPLNDVRRELGVTPDA